MRIRAARRQRRGGPARLTGPGARSDWQTAPRSVSYGNHTFPALGVTRRRAACDAQAHARSDREDRTKEELCMSATDVAAQDAASPAGEAELLDLDIRLLENWDEVASPLPQDLREIGVMLASHNVSHDPHGNRPGRTTSGDLRAVRHLVSCAAPRCHRPRCRPAVRGATLACPQPLRQVREPCRSTSTRSRAPMLRLADLSAMAAPFLARSQQSGAVRPRSSGWLDHEVRNPAS